MRATRRRRSHEARRVSRVPAGIPGGLEFARLQQQPEDCALPDQGRSALPGRGTVSEPQDLLTTAEVAVVMRCHVKTVLRLIRDGKLRASRYGSQQYRIQRAAISECLA